MALRKIRIKKIGNESTRDENSYLVENALDFPRAIKSDLWGLGSQLLF
jgi:hypothetical protein